MVPISGQLTTSKAQCRSDKWAVLRFHFLTSPALGNDKRAALASGNSRPNVWVREMKAYDSRATGLRASVFASSRTLRLVSLRSSLSLSSRRVWRIISCFSSGGGWITFGMAVTLKAPSGHGLSCGRMIPQARELLVLLHGHGEESQIVHVKLN